MRRSFVPGLVVAGLCGFGCGSKLPPIDAAATKEAATAIEEAMPEMRPVFAASALFELEKGRFPPGYLEALDAVSSAPPDMRSTLIAKSVSEHMSLFDDACAADGEETLQKMATLAQGERAKHLWTSCKFGELGLISEAEGLKASEWGLILGHTMWARVKAAGDVDPNEKKLLVILASAPGGEPGPGPADLE